MVRQPSVSMRRVEVFLFLRVSGLGLDFKGIAVRKFGLGVLAAGHSFIGSNDESEASHPGGWSGIDW